ncbi:MAG TPA: ExsB family transcriptional regulator [Planctomycetota bacterium]|nr:ExsB family transcriptional regulator [Planctomycetota bacterium]
MDCKAFVLKQAEGIRRTVGDATAISALSGGVDSSVVTVLGHLAIGKQMKVIFIDDGLMRQDEPQEVKGLFAKLGIQVRVLNAKKRFFDAFHGLTDPEEKRKAFRDTFYKVFGDAVKASGARFLLQGTIAPDIIETKKGVKTQHNVLEQIGIDPESGYGFGVVEPIKTLYKPDVRRVARFLCLPPSISQRMPFPGPGLSARCMGEVTPPRIAIVRKACLIVEQEMAGSKAFQTFGVLLADRPTGITKDGRRREGDAIAIRCVDSKNAVTAQATKISWARLVRMRDRILKEIPTVTKVLCDLTPKPPSTIEYI